jgi:hypothetical protein
LVTESAILDRLNTTYASDWAQPSVTVTPDTTPLTPCSGGTTAPINTQKQGGTTLEPKPIRSEAEIKTRTGKRH